MSKGKVIENPEVPGLEQNLPPPPPGLINPKIESKQHEVTSNGLQKSAPPTVEFPAQPMPDPSSMINPYYVPTPTIQSQLPSSQPTQSVPWWIPTDADTQDVYSHQWYDQKTCYISPPLPPSALAPPPPPPPLPPPQTLTTQYPHHQQQYVDNKHKYKAMKRKKEVVDPVEDAERVASAQRELTALMKPLKCDLCNAVMNSTLQAKLHYDGKPHQKKVSMFLNQSVKKPKVENGQLADPTNANDWNTYCPICKTWFTSETDAAQHYAGKKHIRATTGAPRQKMQKKHSNSVPIDPTGRFGIGVGFKNENQNISHITSPSAESSIPQNISTPAVVSPLSVLESPGYAPEATSYGAALRCDLCGVSANRYEQLETHKRGARHQKMLKLNGFNSTTETVTLDSTTPMVTATIIDYSIYRTPSGSYYCAPCNKSFSSENSFAQHVESKKHKNQVNPKSPQNQTVITSNSVGKRDKSKKSTYKTS